MDRITAASSGAASSELTDRHLADLCRDESGAIVSAPKGGHEAILLERREQAVAGTLGQPEALTDLEQLELGALRRERAQRWPGHGPPLAHAPNSVSRNARPSSGTKHDPTGRLQVRQATPPGAAWRGETGN